jgi:methionine salvage enolase-phosphatase E1
VRHLVAVRTLHVADIIAYCNTADWSGLFDVCIQHTGERRDSATYVRMKKKACDEIGIMSHGVDFASNVTQEELLRYSVPFYQLIGLCSHMQ